VRGIRIWEEGYFYVVNRPRRSAGRENDKEALFLGLQWGMVSVVFRT
jgi:hypothetical protein